MHKLLQVVLSNHNRSQQKWTLILRVVAAPMLTVQQLPGVVIVDRIKAAASVLCAPACTLLSQDLLLSHCQWSICASRISLILRPRYSITPAPPPLKQLRPQLWRPTQLPMCTEDCREPSSQRTRHMLRKLYITHEQNLCDVQNVVSEVCNSVNMLHLKAVTCINTNTHV